VNHEEELDFAVMAVLRLAGLWGAKKDASTIKKSRRRYGGWHRL